MNRLDSHINIEIEVMLR